MKTTRKTMYPTRRNLQLLTVFLVGAVGLLPRLSQSESSGGMDGANEVATSSMRDPFWPVGYKPALQEGSKKEGGAKQKLVAGSGGTDWNAAMKQIVINGVSRAGDEYVAVINNKVMTVGESVAIQYGGTRYTWQVESIAPPSSVKLRRLSAE